MGGAKASCANSFKSIYEIAVHAMDNKAVSMSDYRGKVLLIVNVASKWGLTTKNYEQLVQLEKNYKEQGLDVLAFPCNQFSRQEPGTNEEIASFAKGFGANFTVFSKTYVNGRWASDLYKFLRLNSELDGKEIGWNFGKFLVDRNGSVFKYYEPKIDPVDIESDIEKLL